MTTSHEFDRALAAFLEEGPSRAPDRPIDAALVHARTHPRRRDVFGAFRRDPMGRQARSPFGPALVFATVALLLALSAAVYVGSRPSQPVVVPPISTPSPSTPRASVPPTALPTAVPSEAPSRTPTPAPSGPTSVEVIDGNGAAATIDIVDESGLLRDAQGFPADPERPQDAEIEVIQLPADEVPASAPSS